MTLEILKYPNPLLRRGGKQIESFDAELRATAQQMLETMYEYRGVGLAAPQVGLDVSMLVLNPTGKTDERDEEMVLINPKIKSRKKLEYGEEGCLSFPGIYAEVERHHDVVLTWQDLEGEEHEQKFQGFIARVILHEIDHLNGTLFVDRLSAAERIQVRSKLTELEKNYKSSSTAEG